MAVYSDDGTGKPGAQLVTMPHATALVDGVNQGQAPPNVTVDAGALWVCTVFAQTTSVGAAPVASNRIAGRSMTIIR